MGGRSLSGPVTAADGTPAWLRITAANQRGSKVWEGTSLAEQCLSSGIPRPPLLAAHEWDNDEQAVQALLWGRLTAPLLSHTPDLAAPVQPDPQWWQALRFALQRLRTITSPPGREVITQRYVDRVSRFLPQLRHSELDVTIRHWETSHGDLHWGNLTIAPLNIIDWEGWGPAPAGTDEATLHAYALPHPKVAARVRDAFADVLDTPEGKLAHVTVADQIIQASQRDETHARLAPYVSEFAKKLIL